MICSSSRQFDVECHLLGVGHKSVASAEDVANIRTLVRRHQEETHKVWVSVKCLGNPHLTDTVLDSDHTVCLRFLQV